VIQVEHTEEAGGGGVRFTARSTPDNICARGEDIRQGETVLRRGERILPQHVAVLATVGCAAPLVARRPRVGVIATGDELVEPDRAPGPSQIRNSNGHQLCAQVTRAGAVPAYCGIAPDADRALDRMVKEAAAENDVVMLSGGVSMGDYDLVPGILTRNGFRLHFEKVAVKPGMPTVFGESAGAFCFGLPGNPVSTFVLFEILVKPFLLGLMGHAFCPRTCAMRLAGEFTRRKTDRDAWIPVRRKGEETVEAVEYHGSGHVNSLTQADGLICIARGTATLAQGTLVHVRPI
jgi:molybdopterin molybdotransferase